MHILVNRDVHQIFPSVSSGGQDNNVHAHLLLKLEMTILLQWQMKYGWS